MRLTGVYFDLTDRFAAKRANVGGGHGIHGIGRNDFTVVISVAKRLVASAVRRNTVKRIVREAWRAAVRQAADVGGEVPQSTPQGTSSGSATRNAQSIQANAGIDPIVEADDRPRTCLVRLKRYPGKDVKPAPDRRRQPKAKLKAKPTGTPIARSPVKMGDTGIRRCLRVDADRLFADFLRGRLPGGAGSHAAGAGVFIVGPTGAGDPSPAPTPEP